MSRIASLIGKGNNFYAPFYRSMTTDSWTSNDEETIKERAKVSAEDVKDAFDQFLSTREKIGRPIVLVGFSQGGMAVLELMKQLSSETHRGIAAAYVIDCGVTSQDTLQCKWIKPAKDSSDTGVTVCFNTVNGDKGIGKGDLPQSVMCINPLNWRTDATPAKAGDITITMDPVRNVLVAKGVQSKSDIKGSDPNLYGESLSRNIRLRATKFRLRHGMFEKTPGRGRRSVVPVKPKRNLVK